MMNKNGNLYTLLYALILAAFVAGVLAWVSTSLAPRRKANEEADKIASIRSAAGMAEASVDSLERDGLKVFRTVEGEDTVYVLPCAGDGLWGLIWGYVALEPDTCLVRGASFSHKSETPGLGGRIGDKAFGSLFGGRAFDSSLAGSGIDALSGATMTARGVEKMILQCVEKYVPCFDSTGRFVFDFEKDGQL
ncbi:MAG: FMN-binding protein [Bacteroidales bacterium]|nr:FMN-binding protein [Bacteroidales bacterium]